MRFIAAAAIAALVITGAAEAKTWRIRAGADAEQRLQTALIEARPGDTVQLGRGRFELTSGLSLDVDRVTIRGDGHERSIISFDNQRRGAEGLLITSDNVTLRGFRRRERPRRRDQGARLQRHHDPRSAGRVDARSERRQRRLRALSGELRQRADRALDRARRFGRRHLCRPIAQHHRARKPGGVQRRRHRD
jgi:hypothetical protein